MELDGRGGRVLVVALASPSSGVPREWAATPERSGVAYVPELSEAAARDVGRRLARVRREEDLAVASLHWGSNWGYRIPAGQRRFVRLLVDEAGVDVVHGHPSHHPKGLEMIPMRLRRFRLGRAGVEAGRWMRDTLERESRRLDGVDVGLADDGRLLLRP